MLYMPTDQNKNETLDTIWIVKKLWLDPSENNVHAAMGYAVVGFVASEIEAAKIMQHTPIRVGDGWPLSKGAKFEVYKVSQLKKFNFDDPEAKQKHDPFAVDWAANVGKLRRLHELAGQHEVNFSICYQDGARDWRVKIDSCTPTENFFGKDRSVFGIALDDAIEYLEKL